MLQEGHDKKTNNRQFQEEQSIPEVKLKQKAFQLSNREF